MAEDMHAEVRVGVALEKQLLNIIGNWYKVVELYRKLTIGYNPR
jgi:hypothetical protein